MGAFCLNLLVFERGCLCFRGRSPVDCVPCRIGTRLGKIPVLFLQCWAPGVVAMVSVHTVAAPLAVV